MTHISSKPSFPGASEALSSSPLTYFIVQNRVNFQTRRVDLFMADLLYIKGRNSITPNFTTIEDRTTKQGIVPAALLIPKDIWAKAIMPYLKEESLKLSTLCIYFRDKEKFFKQYERALYQNCFMPTTQIELVRLMTLLKDKSGICELFLKIINWENRLKTTVLNSENNDFKYIEQGRYILDLNAPELFIPEASKPILYKKPKTRTVANGFITWKYIDPKTGSGLIYRRAQNFTQTLKSLQWPITIGRTPGPLNRYEIEIRDLLVALSSLFVLYPIGYIAKDEIVRFVFILCPLLLQLAYIGRLLGCVKHAFTEYPNYDALTMTRPEKFSNKP